MQKKSPHSREGGCGAKGLYLVEVMKEVILVLACQGKPSMVPKIPGCRIKVNVETRIIPVDFARNQTVQRHIPLSRSLGDQPSNLYPVMNTGSLQQGLWPSLRRLPCCIDPAESAGSSRLPWSRTGRGPWSSLLYRV